MNGSLPIKQTCVRSHPEEFALRPTKNGDLCILLEPFEKEELTRLKKIQMALKSAYGGNIVENVHLTCLRFALNNKESQDNLAQAEELNELIAFFQQYKNMMPPFQLEVVDMVTLFVPFEGFHVLKWCIGITPPLRKFITFLHYAVGHVKQQPLYHAWFIPTLITALNNITNLNEEKINTHHDDYSQPLFTAKKFSISKINSPHDYTIVKSFYLQDN